MNTSKISKVAFAAGLFLSFSLLSAHDVQGQASMKDAVSVKRGSSVSAFLNRSKLREYFSKIEHQTITPSEMKDYIEKGGAIETIEFYDVFRNFEVGHFDEQVMNYLIVDPSTDKSTWPPDHLESIKLLLAAGARPNYANEKGSRLGMPLGLPAMLFAARANDVEAMKILVAAGGDPKLTVTIDSQKYGPPIFLASSPEAMDYLQSLGADLSVLNDRGQSLLENAVDQLWTEKVRYLLGRLPQDTRAKDLESARKLADQLVREIEAGNKEMFAANKKHRDEIMSNQNPNLSAEQNKAENEDFYRRVTDGQKQTEAAAIARQNAAVEIRNLLK